MTQVYAGNIWSGGYQPLDEPVCGYTGSKCDYTPYYAGGGTLVAVLLLILGTLLLRRHQ